MFEFIKRPYKRFVHNFIHDSIKLEQEKNIRGDFLDWYKAALSSRSAISRSYSAKSKSWYYHKILEYGEIAKKYNAFKLFLRESDDIDDDLESTTDWATIFDWIRTLIPLIIPSVTYLFSNQLNEFISWTLLIFSTGILLLNWFIELIRIDSEEIQKLIEALIVKEQDIHLSNGNLWEKDRLYGPYIWNKALCNPSTISSFLLLLYLKKFLPSIFLGVRERGLQIYPGYMKTVKKPDKKVDRIGFLLFSIKNWSAKSKKK
jgi:hypothetical protein